MSAGFSDRARRFARRLFPVDLRGVSSPGGHMSATSQPDAGPVAPPSATGSLRDTLSTMRFVFLDPGPLIDNELTLVAPEAKWVDEVMVSCTHPMTVRDAPVEASITRQKLLDFIAAALSEDSPPTLARAACRRIISGCGWIRRLETHHSRSPAGSVFAWGPIRKSKCSAGT